jgi:hypothetical protein
VKFSIEFGGDPGFSYLIDRSDLEVWTYPPRAVAMVATNPARREQAQLAVAYMGGSTSGHRVFASGEDAIAWLREQ